MVISLVLALTISVFFDTFKPVNHGRKDNCSYILVDYMHNCTVAFSHFDGTCSSLYFPIVRI